MKTILIIEDETTLRKSLSRVLSHHGYLTVKISTKKQFYELPKNSYFDIVLLDLKLPDGDSLELIKPIKQKNQNTQVIIMTGYGTIDLAIKATKKGAFHFITKPFNMGEIINLCSQSISQATLKTENETLRKIVKKQYSFEQIIGQSPVILDLLDLIKKISCSNSTVLISGESGTGKELIAKAIHFNSSKKSQPFVPVHCGAIPKELLESELFGHIKGSFTGAIKNRIGRFQQAQGGTLFLDEIGTMEPATQVKLLRVLQEKSFQPVGGDHTLYFQGRIVAATNENLIEAVKKGTFREDLYYRLNIIPLNIPPLRNRKIDIPILIKSFIQKLNNHKVQKFIGLSAKAIEQLMQYQWPGNIRELENLMERLSVLNGTKQVEVEDLPMKYRSEKNTSFDNSSFLKDISELGIDFNTIITQCENKLILQALEKTKWNRNQAAKLLNLNRTTLLEKIKKKGLKQSAPALLESPQINPNIDYT